MKLINCGERMTFFLLLVDQYLSLLSSHYCQYQSLGLQLQYTLLLAMLYIHS